MPELTPLFLTAYGLRWFLWEYKWFATVRDWLEKQHPILKELVGCSYCQSIECFLITWLVFHLNHLTQLHPVEVLGYALFFGWLGWVIASLEKYIPD